MVAPDPGRLANRLASPRPRPAVFEKTEVLGPGYVDENRHPRLIRAPQEPFRRNVIRAQGVDPGGLHARQVVCQALGRGERLALGVAGEGAVRHAVDSQGLSTAHQHLAGHLHAFLNGIGDSLSGNSWRL